MDVELARKRRREYIRQWREQNHDKWREIHRRSMQTYRERHREEYNAYCREYNKRPDVKRKRHEYYERKKERQNENA